MSTYFRAVSRSGRRCPRLRCGELGSGCPAGTSPVFSTDDAGCPVCTCRQLTAFLRPSTTCAPLDCSHLVCVGPVRFSSRLVGRCPICECVAIDEATGSSGPVTTSSSCPELDCPDHFRCQGGRKRDELTGCETCECLDDDCSDCTAACSGSEPTRCAAVCGCDFVDEPVCRPLPIDCELRVGCVLRIDMDGCEICQCAAEMSPTASACPQMTCSLTCAGAGYAVDENGCRVCACAVEEAETTTTTVTSVMTKTSCAPVDCAIQCPAEFDVVEGDDGCDVCICVKPETVSDSDDDVINDDDGDATASRCAHVTRDDCDSNCAVATDDVGCQFCLCEDRAPDQETETTDAPTTTVVDREVDEATTRSAEDTCRHQFVCHPVCEAVADDRGCVVECRCDNLISSLADMQQEQQPEVVVDYESRAACPTSDDVCSCGVDEEERRSVSVDGCPTCVCATPSTTTSVQSTTSSATDTRTTVTTSPQEVTAATPTVAAETESTSTAVNSSHVRVDCRQLSDGDCAHVTCGDAGYAKDEHGCDVCTCHNATNEQQPAKTVQHVVAAARKGNVVPAL